jgi:putative SOS response-associated peptidase YedK
MCFTVNVNLVKEELENRYGASFLDPDSYRPSYYYHAFGLPDMPALCQGKPERIRLLKWGLIPGWVKSDASAEEIRYKTFNARAESVADKPSFAASFSSKRCIVPVRGFYEWQHLGKKKIPWYICRADNDVMSLAGLWSEWMESSTGLPVSTFSVITTDANELMSEIHNTKKRMPALLERSAEKVWLENSTPEDQLMTLLKPYPSSILNAYTIGDLITSKSADRNHPDIIRPVKREPDNLLF